MQARLDDLRDQRAWLASNSTVRVFNRLSDCGRSVGFVRLRDGGEVLGEFECSDDCGVTEVQLAVPMDG